MKAFYLISSFLFLSTLAQASAEKSNYNTERIAKLSQKKEGLERAVQSAEQSFMNCYSTQSSYTTRHPNHFYCFNGSQYSTPILAKSGFDAIQALKELRLVDAELATINKNK